MSNLIANQSENANRNINLTVLKAIKEAFADEFGYDIPAWLLSEDDSFPTRMVCITNALCHAVRLGKQTYLPTTSKVVKTAMERKVALTNRIADLNQKIANETSKKDLMILKKSLIETKGKLEATQYEIDESDEDEGEVDSSNEVTQGYGDMLKVITFILRVNAGEFGELYPRKNSKK